MRLLLLRTILWQQLLSFFGVLFLLLLLIIAWNLITNADALALNVLTIMLASLYKGIARLHEVLPFALVLSVAHVMLTYAKTKQMLAMRLLGYRFYKLILPVWLSLVLLVCVVAAWQQQARPGLMLAANAKYCQAGLTKHCQASQGVWSYQPAMIVHVIELVSQNNKLGKAKALAQVINIDPNANSVQSVIWPATIKYSNGLWWYQGKPLALQLKPDQLQYAGLSPADQPHGYQLPPSLLLTMVLSILITLYAWKFTNESKA